MTRSVKFQLGGRSCVSCTSVKIPRHLWPLNFYLFIFALSAQGACILNMLRDFLTPDVFEIGIIRYLKRYSYQNTVNSHLWESLTDVSTSAS